MVRKALVIALLAAATPSQAQTSTCSWVGHVWTCRNAPDAREQTRNMYSNYTRRIQENADRQRTAQEEQQQQFNAQANQASAAALRQRVGAAIKRGDCNGGVNLALDAGDIDLAAQAKQLCSED